MKSVAHRYIAWFSVKVPKEITRRDSKRSKCCMHRTRHAGTSIAQLLPKGVNGVDGELSSAISGNGAGIMNADIAILDTGIQLTYPDLYVYRQKTFVSETSSANHDNGHGIHVAGIGAAKDNSIGVVGMAPRARLWSVKVLNSSGSGSISTIIKDIDYVTKNVAQIDIANLSLGCECTLTSLNTAITNTVKVGVTYVVGAGNN